MKKRRIFGAFQFIADLIVVLVSYFLIVNMKSLTRVPYTLPNIIAIKAILPYILTVFVALFFIYRLYEFENLDFYEIFLGIVFSTIIIFIFTLAFSFFFRAFAVPRTLIIYSFFIQIILLPISHFIISKIYFKVSSPLNFLCISKSTKSVASTFVEFINSEREKRGKIETEVLKSIEQLDNLESRFSDFSAFIIDNSFSLKEKEKIIKYFVYKEKPAYIVPDTYDLMLLLPRVHIVSDKLLLEVNLVNISSLDRLLKRALDIIVSIVALIIFFLVILVVSILILVDSGRPIFYLQERAGVNGKIFRIIKFRSMIKDAEKETGVVLSYESDPRVTKIGKFLRKTGLDEVPQFFNVLKGEMSIVGPRPERPESIEEIKKDTPDFDMRLKVKPGITGYAQIYGKYDTPFEEKLRMDLLYAKQKYVVFTDIFIIFNTIKLFFLFKKRQ